MCGIFGYFIKNNQSILDYPLIFSNFLNSSGRGPDDCYFKYQKNKYFLGFHRLSINDISSNGNQPFKFVCENGTTYTVICNGEIYNSQELKKLFPNYKFKSSSDCEVIIPLFMAHGYHFVDMLKGVFAFIIIEEIYEGSDFKYNVIFGRDRFGVRPLYKGETQDGNIILSSEYKSLMSICDTCEQVKPGTVIKILDNGDKETYHYYLKTRGDRLKDDGFDFTLDGIKSMLINAVIKRIENTDRPVCAFLSGGLDSSLVCAISAKYLNERTFPKKKLNTFAIGFENSTDLEYARKVSEFIGSNHHEYIITKEQAIKSIKDVIWAIESYDITTVRASVGQYLISKYIADNTDFKVILSGDGSDEVCGGYLENYLAPNLDEFKQNTFNRINNIYKYDVQRADRATSIHGLEIRVPFLDYEFVEYMLRIPAKERMPVKGVKMEKQLLRDAFIGYLPEEILYRQKEAFSDGISSTHDSWNNIIKEMCNDLFTQDEFEEKLNFYKLQPGACPICRESLYYRIIFEQLYGTKHVNLLDEHWMQNWSNSDDPSARSLEVY